MTNDPKVSVVVPVYKVEQYIKFCVDSILEQTFQDFEIILVDDASPDRSFEICRELYGDNDKVKFIRHEKNLGLGPARNTGMKHARGKYLYFVDSDDFILPNALEKFFNAAEKTNAQIVHAAGWYELLQDEPTPVRKENLQLRWDGYSKEGFLPANPPYRIEEHWKKNATWPMAWLCFCRRDFMEENNIDFLPIISEDETFSFALFCLAERYYIIHEALYIYRRRSGSIMKTKNPEQLSKSIQSIAHASVYLKNFLDKIPHFKNYELWCENTMEIFFRRYVNNHTTPYYRDLAVTAETNDAVNTTLKKIFTSGAPFVRYFFTGYHLYRRQAELLQNKNYQTETEISSLINRAKIYDNKIVFVNFSGRGYGCNPKYIAEEILRQNLPYDLVWLVRDMNEPMPEKIRKVKYGSMDSVYELATAKVVVTNVKNQLPFPSKKKGQFFIMTSHAWWSVKWIEKDAEEKLSASYVKQSKAISAMTDLMMVGTQERFEEFRRAMWYDGEILKCGLPRNDIYFRHDEKLVARIMNALHIPPENKIVMYAPTFRDDYSATDVYKFDTQKVLDALTKRFGGQWTLIIRFHPNIAKEKFAQAAFNVPNVINATSYPDMQELILISDVLISDYSSVICDFMFTGKKVFLFAKDFDTYPVERGFKPLFFELPYKVNRSEDELLAGVETFDETALEPKVRAFIDKIKLFDNGYASEIVVSRIKAVIEKK